jgi:hypothetical protein
MGERETVDGKDIRSAAVFLIPFDGHGDLFSAIGHRLRNLGRHPSKISASEGLPYWLRPPGRPPPPNKPLWQGHGRPSITQRGKHAMLIAQQIDQHARQILTSYTNGRPS